MTIADTVSDSVAIQYFDGAQWVQFGDTMSLGAIRRDRRIASHAGKPIVAQKWRVVKVGATDWGGAQFFLDAVRFWREAAVPAGEADAVRFWSFSFNGDDQRYVMALTPGNLEIYRGGQRCGSAASPYLTRDQVRAVTKTQQLDTLLAFHNDVEPWRFMRQGYHKEWDSRPAEFEELPIFDYGAAYTNGVNEVQRIILRDYMDGDTFNITLEGSTTNSITFDGGATAANIQAALEALPTVGAGNVVAAVYADADNLVQINVTFQGDLAGQDMGQMAPVTIDSEIDPDTQITGVVTCATITQGQAPGEPVISATRGWPAAGCFYQQRLVMAGLRSRPQTVLASRLGSYYNFNPKGGGDNGAMDESLSGYEAASAIKQVFPGRHLQLFSSSSEYYFTTPALKPFSPTQQATRRGIEPGVPVAEMDGATLFVANGGDALVRFSYDFTVESYQADHLSAMASHLVKGVTDFTVRKARSTTQPHLGVLVRGDQQLTALVAMLEQEVAAFVPWTTTGSVLAVGSEFGGDVYIAVDRQGVRCIERFVDGVMLDSTVPVQLGSKLQTGLEHVEGQTVTVWADGDDQGDYLVENGQIVLQYAPEREGEIGLLFKPRGRTLPLVLQQDPRAGKAIGARIGEIALRLGPTINLRAGMAGGRMWKVMETWRAPALLDTGPGDNPYTGWARVAGVPGFASDAQVEWVQERPGPLEIQELVATVTS